LLVIEGYLAATFVRWRIRLRKGAPVSLERKARLVRFHYAEFWLILGMVAMATSMARGVGVVKPKGPEQTAAPDEAKLFATGEGVYRRYCVTCHQVDGRGLEGKLAADFRSDPRRLAKPDAELGAIVSNGVPGTAMRAFRAELDDVEIRGVVAYLRKRFGPGAER
jgi:mono/diheme cytochrome c family protein